MYKFEVWRGWIEYPFGGGMARRMETREVIAANVREALKKSGIDEIDEYDLTDVDYRRMNWAFKKPDTRERDEEGMLSGMEAESWIEVTLLGAA